jgi:hypothetical protein
MFREAWAFNHFGAFQDPLRDGLTLDVGCCKYLRYAGICSETCHRTLRDNEYHPRSAGPPAPTDQNGRATT